MTDKLNITRRDFLNGVALSLAAGTSLSPLELLAQQTTPANAPYPPMLTGLRGSHVGSFEIAHTVAMGGAKFGAPSDQTDSDYDLVVVGAGISGLASAYLFQQHAGADKKVLVLDNHDDFGGHARRNEFDIDGQSMIAYGGSQSLESPSLYSQQSKDLLADLGIDLQLFYDYFDQSFFSSRNLKPAIHFSADKYGQSKLAPNVWTDWVWEQDQEEIERVIDAYPIAVESRALLTSMLFDEIDYLDGRSEQQKIDLLRGMSYSTFLTQHVGANTDLVTLVRDTIKSYWGVAWDALSALEAYRLEMPGTYGLGLRAERDPSWTGDEPYIFHFPDGNASIARILLRRLLPHAVPGNSMQDIVQARVDYSLLDEASASCRVRLNSTVVDVRHSDDESGVDVTYIQDGRPQRVHGRHVVLACYNRVIPHITPELPPQQREAIEQAVKTPLAYISIAIRHWRAFDKLGIHSVYVPQADLMHSFSLDFPVSMGGYQYTGGPDEPAVLHGVFCPNTPDQGLSNKEQAVAGQRRLLGMSFADFEGPILRQLDAALKAGGFDAQRDVAAITVNRWPHGYAYEYNDLFDGADTNQSSGPHIAGRARIGRISIANSDSEASAYVDGAFDAAIRAVDEQLNL